MKVAYSKRAANDLRSIAVYHQQSGDPRLGERIAAAIKEVIARIAAVPFIGRRVDQRPGVYVTLLRRFRYLIFYEVLNAETIRILHIRHAARRRWEY